ncbi:hypothetical protein M0805_007900 [Coniferiporia weirii]|nr:hypothetical protein M0805_007900 [Coniferiporia weirii]
MSAPGFSFVPRKLAGPGKKSVSGIGTPSKAASSSKSGSTSAWPAAQRRTLAGVVEQHDCGLGPENANEKIAVGQKTDYKRKQKETEKYLEDGAYAVLLELTLSEHALWADRGLLERADAREGFVPLSYVTRRAPVFVGLAVPPEPVLVRCARPSALLECRMAVIEPDQNAWFARGDDNGSGAGPSEQEGGFEVRRRDWEKTRERIRKCTAFQWDNKTVYIENLPHYARTVPAVHRFLRDLLEDVVGAHAGGSCEGMAALQSISFSASAGRPVRGRGYAFVILARTEAVDHLLQRWPWSTDDVSSRVRRQLDAEGEVPGGASVTDARDFGLRCVSKRRWDALKGEYLALQQQLLAKIAAPDQLAGASSPTPQIPVRTAGTSAHKRVDAQRKDLSGAENNSPLPPMYRIEDELPYPVGCLAFVKNVHPGTNKTTLKTLFLSALGGAGDAIDYVDYNKGLDTCYLRLATPTYANTLVAHFSAHKIAQRDALDGEGVTVAPNTPSIEVELVQGKKEEMYWEKVPDNIKKRAVAKARIREGSAVGEGSAAPGVQEEGTTDLEEVGKKRKRRRRG